MSDTTDPSQLTIVGRITPWFTKRMVMMLAMFFGFSAYFFYDWKIGYPEKRVIYDTYLTYDLEALKLDGKEDEWKENLNAWVKEAKDNDWDVNLDSINFEPKTKIDDAKIAEQLYFGIGTGVISLGVLVYFLISLRKTVEVDGEAVKLPNGIRVPYSVIKKVDTRRWGNKGLATIVYDDGAGLKGSAKIDGLKFGGFIKPEPYKADLILKRIIESFRGDLIELQELEEEKSQEAEESGDETMKGE